MAEYKAVTPFSDLQVTSDEIEVVTISVGDLWVALQQGYQDFGAKPSFGVFLMLVYPLLAFLITWFALGESLVYLAFPMVAGLTLIGPMISIALFEMSRIREHGNEPTWHAAFNFIHTSAFAPIMALSIIMMLLYVAWLLIAESLYFGTVGMTLPSTMADFTNVLFTTRQGAALILYGLIVGFLFAFTALAVSVVGFPLLLDRPSSCATAITVSVRAVIANPLPMAVWGLTVVTLLVVGAALLVGLAVVLPVLGHATWHLYRRLVVQ